MSTDISKLVPEEEQISPKKAKTLASYLDNIGLALALWIFVYPHPYKLVFSIALVFPLTMLYIYYKYRKQISLEDDSDSKVQTKQPSLLSAMTIPSLGLALRALIDYDLLNFADCLIAWCVIFLILSMVVIWITSSSTVKIGLFSKDSAAVFIFIFSYSYGSMIMVDCLYDNTKPEIYHTRVLDKHKSGGRHTSYYLTVDVWGNRTASEDVSVTNSLFNDVSPGETIDIYVEKGTLNIPWYYVDK